MIRREVNRATAISAATYGVIVVVSAAYTRVVTIGVLAAVVAAIAIASARARARKMLEAYRLIISDDAIRVLSDSVLADTEIARHDVTSIEERKGEGIAVRSSDRRLVGVRFGIEGYDHIRAVLQSWRPIEVKPRGHFRIWSPILSVAVIAAIMGIIIFNDPRIVFPIGAALALGLLASIIMALRSNALSSRTKAMMFVSVVPLGLIIARIVQVLTQ